GLVWVTWHAPAKGKKGPENRQVWIALSKDDGKTFLRERPVSAPESGACPCCGMRAFTTGWGSVYILFRAAAQGVHRDTHLLFTSNSFGKFKEEMVQAWDIDTCPMSTYAFAVMASPTWAESNETVLAAWETKGQVSFCKIHPLWGKFTERK